MIMNNIQEFCINLFLINCLVNFLIFLLKMLYFKKKINSEVPNRLHMKDKTTDAINHVKNKHKQHGTKERIFNHITKTKTSID